MAKENNTIFMTKKEEEFIDEIANDIVFTILNSSYDDVSEYESLKEIVLKCLRPHFSFTE